MLYDIIDAYIYDGGNENGKEGMSPRVISDESVPWCHIPLHFYESIQLIFLALIMSLCVLSHV